MGSRDQRVRGVRKVRGFFRCGSTGSTGSRLPLRGSRFRVLRGSTGSSGWVARIVLGIAENATSAGLRVVVTANRRLETTRSRAFLPVRLGHTPCSSIAVAGVKRFEDLIAYQRAVELRDLVYDMTASPRLASDTRFRDQVRDSACSAPRNLAEGFSRFAPRDFARFVTIARGSIAETQNHLTHGLRQGYFTPNAYDQAWKLSCRAMAAIAGLAKYLRNCRGPVGSKVR